MTANSEMIGELLFAVLYLSNFGEAYTFDVAHLIILNITALKLVTNGVR
jgi:hypothetical protein